MDLTLTRTQVSSDGVFSELRLPSRRILAITAEHAYAADDGTWKPKIVDGTYVCKRSMHRLHGMTNDFETFQVMDVPNHTNILLHVGNWPQVDSDGCILVGNGMAPSSKGPMVTDSRRAFAEFMTQLKDVNEFNLIVVS